MKTLLEIQLKKIKAVFDKEIQGLDKEIYGAMDF